MQPRASQQRREETTQGTTWKEEEQTGPSWSGRRASGLVFPFYINRTIISHRSFTFVQGSIIVITSLSLSLFLGFNLKGVKWGRGRIGRTVPSGVAGVFKNDSWQWSRGLRLHSCPAARTGRRSGLAMCSPARRGGGGRGGRCFREGGMTIGLGTGPGRAHCHTTARRTLFRAETSRAWSCLG